MRFMGKVLSEETLRSVFVSRCAVPVFVLRDKFGEALGDIGLASVRKIRTKLTSATRCCLRLREKAMPAKRCGQSAVWFHHPGGAGHHAQVLSENRGSSRLLEKQGWPHPGAGESLSSGENRLR